MSAAGELRTQVLGSEIRGVTAARREGLAGLVRTLTFTVGVRWWGQASEGSEQRRMLYFSGYGVLSGCRGRSKEKSHLQTPYWGLHRLYPGVRPNSGLRWRHRPCPPGAL